MLPKFDSRPKRMTLERRDSVSTLSDLDSLDGTCLKRKRRYVLARPERKIRIQVLVKNIEAGGQPVLESE